jgi:hypothetical protein
MKLKKDLRSIYDMNPRYCLICGKRLHAKQDIACSRQCSAKYRVLKHEKMSILRERKVHHKILPIQKE